MNTDLTVPGDATPALTPTIRAGALDYPTMLELGKAFAASGLFPGVKDQGVAVVKILAGAEMGLEPVAAMNGIDIIPGRGDRGPRMRPNADVQAWLAARAGYSYRPIEHTAEKCVLEWTHDGKAIGTSEFTVAQARKAGLVRDGGAWNTWPEPMTLARAITHGVKLYCRHVLAGHIGGMQIVTTDELEQEYPDPRDDLVRALHATYREAYPRKEGETEEHYRGRRLVWSAHVLGRPVPSWNGPDYPETLTRADVQTLLDALQAAPDSGPPAGPLAPEHPGPANISAGETGKRGAPDKGGLTGNHPPAEHHTQGSAGGAARPQQVRASGQSEAPAEHHSDEELGEVPSPEGAEPGGGASDMTGMPPSGPAPTRKRRRTDPGGAPSVAQVQAHQKTAEQTRKQTTVEREEDDSLHLMPPKFNRLYCEWFEAQHPETWLADARNFAQAHIEKWKTEETWTGKYQVGQLEFLAAETFEKEPSK